MNKLEAKLTVQWQKWAKAYLDHTCLWEIKVARTHLFPFSAVKDHQIVALKAAGKKFIYKLSDANRVQMPCDGVTICNAPGYVVVIFYQPRKLKRFYMIEVSVFLDAQAKWPRKSLTAADCSDLAYKTGDL